MMLQQKLLSSLIVAAAVLLLCLFAFPIEAKAADVTSGTCGDNLTWTLDTDTGIMFIQGTGDMEYFRSDAPWLQYKPYIKEIVIKEGVLSISANAFEELTALKTVTIPSSITTIKAHAFFGCTELEKVNISNLASWCKITFASYTANPVYYASNLYLNGNPVTDVVIPEGITALGYALFANCDTLKSVVIPEGVTTIGEGTFDGCSNLANVIMPTSITVIDERAFALCAALKSIALPDSVTSIGAYAFKSCEELSSITIPNGVTSIGKNTFYYCENMTSVVLPTSLKLIESDAFKNCPLQHVLYKGSQTQWEAITIVQYNLAIYKAGIVYNALDGMSGEHTYGTWTNVDNNSHERICATCGKILSEYHEWDTGIITVPSTCKDNGIKTFTCYFCGGERTKSIELSSTHTYDNDCDTACNICGYTRTVTHNFGTTWQKDDTHHWHVCSCGEIADKSAHTWDAGVVTKQPSCKEEGVKAFTCTACSATKTETLAKLNTHTYNNACDASCNVCAQTRTVTHSYSTQWSKDKTNHWHECTICGNKDNVAPHTPGAAATETDPQTCTACGYVIQAALGHTHKYSNTLTHDETNHWYACACGEKQDVAEHRFDSGCDTDCDTCGYTRDVIHSFGTVWQNDDIYHWHACACGEVADKTGHSYGADYFCTVCGFEDPDAPAPTDPPATEPQKSVAPNFNDSGIPWWSLLIAGGVCFAGGGVAVLFISKKKK